VTVAPSVPVVDHFLLDEPDAAELCAVARNTFRKWVKLGLIRPVDLPHTLDAAGNPKPLRRKLYRRSDVVAFVDGLPGAEGAS
jgi:hypothetical protein